LPTSFIRFDSAAKDAGFPINCQEKWGE